MSTDLALTGAQARELERHKDAVHKLQDEEQTHAVKTALQLGEHLLAMRDLLDTGAAFVEYVLKHCGYSKSTAYNYIAAFEVFGKAKYVELFEDSAMYLLAKDSTPEAAYEQAMTLASRGTKITKTKAQEIIDKVLAKSKAMQANDSPPVTAEVQQLENDTQQGGDDEEPEADDDPTDISEEPTPARGDVHGLTPKAVDEAMARLQEQERAKAATPEPAEPNELGELRKNIDACYRLWTNGPPHFKVFVDETLRELMGASGA